MNEEYKYEPYSKVTLQTKAIKLTRKILKHLDYVSSSQARELSADECIDVINDYILEFQYYIGADCGDKATHYFGYPYDEHLLEAHKDPNADDKLDDALIMGNDVILEGECGLFKWVNNLIAYGESCYGDPKYLASSFHPNHLDFNGEKIRLLMEERLGLVAKRFPEWATWNMSTEGWVYTTFDARGAEYGEWWFSIGKDNEHDEFIEVTKWFSRDNRGFGAGGKSFNLKVPFGDFYTFYKEVVG